MSEVEVKVVEGPRQKDAKESVTLWFNAIYALVLIFSEAWAAQLLENQTLVLAVIGFICNVIIRYFFTNSEIRK